MITRVNGLKRFYPNACRRLKPAATGISCYFILSLIMTASAMAAPGDAVRLAAGGRASLPVIISGKADESIRRSAWDLADVLGRMAGCQFDIRQDVGENGIIVGMMADFASLPVKTNFDSADPARQEEYLLCSDGRSLYIIGSSPLAVQDAVWDLLYRLGYRQFFPNPNWEVVPKAKDISIAVNDRQRPDFLDRNLWTSHGTWFNNGKYFREWTKKNRAVSGFPISTSHAYGAIRSNLKKDFDEHPEYLGLLNGKRKSSKFCISNPGLRKLITSYALNYFERNPKAISISMEPSDGGDWCQCEPCAKMGSICDRMIILCNDVAEAVNAKYGNKYIGTLSYYQHTGPPNVKVHPLVAVNIAMGLRTGGLSTEDLIDGWRRQGTRTVGLTYNVGGPWVMQDIPRVVTEFPMWHDKGINRFIVDIMDQWGQSGLGNYILARVLWDVDEGQKREALLKDFFSKSFGPAAAPMEGFFSQINRLQPDSILPPLTGDRLGRMYRYLSQAMSATADTAIRRRIGDMAIYTRIQELQYLAGKAPAGTDHDRASADLMRFVYRTRDSQMIHAKRMFAYPQFYSLSGYEKGGLNRLPEGKSPWKDGRPVLEEEIAAIIAAGARNYVVKDVSVIPVAFGSDLVPAQKGLDLPDTVNPRMGSGYHYWGRRFYTWIDKAPGEIRMKVRAGRADGGIPSVKLYYGLEVTLEPVDTDRSVSPGEEKEIVLKSSYAGLHRIEVEGGGFGTQVLLTDVKQARTYDCSVNAPGWGGPRWTMFFYVPKGTKTVGGFAERNGTVRDGTGRLIFRDGMVLNPDEKMSPSPGKEGKPWEGGYFNIPVPPGQDGKTWMLDGCAGRWFLLTVPPYLAETPGQLLLPEEVVRKDAAR